MREASNVVCLGARRSRCEECTIAGRCLARDPEHDRKSLETTGIDMRLILAVGVGSLRYAEDEVERCVERGIDQYVILGAGFDTFTLRRADMVGRLRVFEVDFPDVQALKRERIRAAKQRPASMPTFVPCLLSTSPSPRDS